MTVRCVNCNRFKSEDDNHPFCVTCKGCTSDKPCDFCSKWPLETWLKISERKMKRQRKGSHSVSSSDHLSLRADSVDMQSLMGYKIPRLSPTATGRSKESVVADRSRTDRAHGRTDGRTAASSLSADQADRCSVPDLTVHTSPGRKDRTHGRTDGRTAASALSTDQADRYSDPDHVVRSSPARSGRAHGRTDGRTAAPDFSTDQADRYFDPDHVVRTSSAHSGRAHGRTDGRTAVPASSTGYDDRSLTSLHTGHPSPGCYDRAHGRTDGRSDRRTAGRTAATAVSSGRDDSRKSSDRALGRMDGSTDGRRVLSPSRSSSDNDAAHHTVPSSSTTYDKLLDNRSSDSRSWPSDASGFSRDGDTRDLLHRSAPRGMQWKLVPQESHRSRRSRSRTPVRRRRESPSPTRISRSSRGRSRSPMSPSSLRDIIRSYQVELDRLNKLQEDTNQALRSSDASDSEMLSAANEIYKWLSEDVCPRPSSSSVSSSAKPPSRADRDVTCDTFRPLPTGAQVRSNYKAVMDARLKQDSHCLPPNKNAGRFNARVYTTHDNFMPVKASTLDDYAETLDMREPRFFKFPSRQVSDVSTLLRRSVNSLNFLDLAEAALDEALKAEQSLANRDSISRLIRSIFRSTNDTMGHVISALANMDSLRRSHILSYADQLQSFRKKELQRLPLNSQFLFGGEIKNIRQEVFAENSNRAVMSSIRLSTGRSSPRRSPRRFPSRSRPRNKKRSASVRGRSSSRSQPKRVRFDSSSRASKPNNFPSGNSQRFSDYKPRKKFQ